MRIDYLKNFIELAHCDNFSDAAKRLHISQPVLSKHISLLEKEFGVLLFTRNKPHVELTEQGKILLEEAFFIVEHYQRAKKLLQESKNEFNVLTFGGLNRNADVVELITHVLYRMQEEQIDVTLKRKEFHDQPHLEQLLEDRIDLLFSILNLAEHPLDEKLEAHFLFNNPVLVLMQQDHNLASRETLRLADLSTETIVLPLGSYALVGRQIIEPKLSTLSPPPGMRPVFFEDINDFASVVLKDELLFIESALFETFRFPETIVAVPVDARDIVFPVYAIIKKTNAHKFLHPLIDLILEVAASMISSDSRSCLPAFD